jgi:hypothetical protein
MRETIIIRLNEHQMNNGVQEYSAEVAIPGRYVTTVIGISQIELMHGLIDSFAQILHLLEIPQDVQRPVATASPDAQFFDEHGTPQEISPFAATAKARFEAEVIRNGVVVTDDPHETIAIE